MSWMDNYSEQAIVDAMVVANADRRRLAFLRANGRVVRRDSLHTQKNIGFVRLIEELAFPAPAVNLAIRPRKKKKR